VLAVNGRTRFWWLSGALVAAVGVAAIIVGNATGGPDALDGIIIGVVALLAAGVILFRKASE